MTLLLARVLTLISAILTSLLLLVMLLITRFYQRTANERSGYGLFLIPAALFLAAGIRYVWLAGGQVEPMGQMQVAGDPMADLLRFSGGAVLLYLCVCVYRLMTGSRR